MKYVDRLLAFALGAAVAVAALLMAGTWRYGSAPDSEVVELRAKVAAMEQAMRAAEKQRYADFEQKKRAAEARAEEASAKLKQARENIEGKPLR